MDVEALIAQGPVECSDEGVVRWLARSREVDPDRMVISPEIDETTGKFRAIVSKDVSRRATLPDKAVQHVHDMFAPQALADFNRQRLAAEDVDDRQCAELVAIAELVMDEVQAPDLVQTLRLDRSSR